MNTPDDLFKTQTLKPTLRSYDAKSLSVVLQIP